MWTPRHHPGQRAPETLQATRSHLEALLVSRTRSLEEKRKSDRHPRVPKPFLLLRRLPLRPEKELLLRRNGMPLIGTLVPMINVERFPTPGIPETIEEVQDRVNRDERRRREVTNHKLPRIVGNARPSANVVTGKSGARRAADALKALPFWEVSCRRLLALERQGCTYTCAQMQRADFDVHTAPNTVN